MGRGIFLLHQLLRKTAQSPERTRAGTGAACTCMIQCPHLQFHLFTVLSGSPQLSEKHKHTRENCLSPRERPSSDIFPTAHTATQVNASLHVSGNKVCMAHLIPSCLYIHIKYSFRIMLSGSFLIASMMLNNGPLCHILHSAVTLSGFNMLC